jgi:hypothetical protein
MNLKKLFCKLIGQCQFEIDQECPNVRQAPKPFIPDRGELLIDAKCKVCGEYKLTTVPLTSNKLYKEISTLAYANGYVDGVTKYKAANESDRNLSEAVLQNKDIEIANLKRAVIELQRRCNELEWVDFDDKVKPKKKARKKKKA